MNPALRALKPYPMAELQARKTALINAGKTVFDFGTGDPIEPTPAFIPECPPAGDDEPDREPRHAEIQHIALQPWPQQVPRQSP